MESKTFGMIVNIVLFLIAIYLTILVKEKGGPKAKEYDSFLMIIGFFLISLFSLAFILKIINAEWLYESLLTPINSLDKSLGEIKLTFNIYILVIAIILTILALKEYIKDRKEAIDWYNKYEKKCCTENIVFSKKEKIFTCIVFFVWIPIFYAIIFTVYETLF